MIKRCVLVSPYAMSVPGGVQEQVLAMSRDLSRRGVEVLLLAPDSDDEFQLSTPAHVERFGKLLSLPANGSKAPVTLSWSAARKAFDAISTFDPQIVHFHEPFAPLLGWKALLAHKFASVGTIHRSGSGPAISLTRPMLTKLSRGIDLFAAVSEMAAKTYTSSLAAKPRVLFNGFEIERFQEFPLSRPTTPTFLVIGRLEERKGVDTAIGAVQLHNRSSDEKWKLRIIGDGPEGNRLRSLSESDSTIEFLGRVSDEIKRQEIRSASALVAPSLHGESFGLILIEAMASEIPVVASDIDGYRQASGGHAILVPPSDPAKLAAGMQTALTGSSNEQRASALSHARHWSMEALMDSYLEFYEEAIQRFDRV